MANRIYIKLYNRITDEANYIIDSPLQEDVTLDIQTSYTDVGEIIPSFLSTAINLMKTGTQLSSKASKGLTDIMSQPIWDKAEPLKISTNLIFYTQTDPKKDVLEKALSLCALNVLSSTITGTYNVPGIAFSDMKKIREEALYKTNKDYSSLFSAYSKSTVCSILIPGIIFLPVAICIASKPIFSKEVVLKNGFPYPLWCKVDIELRSITPATLDMLTSQYDKISQITSTLSFFEDLDFHNIRGLM